MVNNFDTPVSLDIVNPVDTAVSIDTKAEGNPTPTATIADNRSRKAAYGVGELLGKSQTELYTLIAQGRENDLRNEATTKINALNEQKRIARVVELAQRQGKTLTIDEMNALRKPPSDPNAVFEDSYADKYLSNLFSVSAVMDGTDVTTAMSTAPKAVVADLEKVKEQLSNHDYARRKQEDMQQLYENQGWMPWLVDQSKQVINPFYSTFKLRGWMEGVGPFDGWLNGSNLYEQTRALLRLPGPQFRERLDYILTRLGNDNPGFAQQYANAVVGMSTSEMGLANVGNIVDIGTMPGLTPALKAGLKSVFSTRKAISDAAKAAANSAIPTPATVAEGFGDAGTAAALRASEATVSDMRGVVEPVSNSAKTTTPNNPINRARQALPTGLQIDTANIAANGRPLSQELLNRIVQDQEVATKRIVDVIEKTASVQRIPLEQASDIVYNRLKEEVKNQSPGIKNAIADVGDFVWNPFSKTYDTQLKIFNWTGEQFSTEATARRFAKQHGIEEYEVVGKAGAKYFIPEAAVKRPWESATRLGEVRVVNGELRVFLDDGSEVATSITPRPGMIPVTVDAKGGVKFGKTLANAVEASKAAIEQQGLGYHITLWKGLDESQNIIKDMMINLESTKSIASRGGVEAWFNSLFPTRAGGIIGLMRSSDNTLSPFEIQQRGTATYSISNFQKLLQAEAKHIQDLARGRITVDPVTGEDKNAILSYIRTLSPITMWKAKDKWKDFKRALELAPSIKDKQGNNGYLWANPYEINEGWRENFGRAASFEEIRAWLAFRRNYENDRVFRSMREYTNKARLGAEQHQVTYIDKTGNKVASPFFDGVQHKTLPGGEYPILILDGPSPRVRWTNKMGSDYQRINKAVTDGEMVVTEIYAPELRPLKNMPEVGYNYVRYIVTPSGNRTSKPLSWEQVNRLSGGHFNYEYENAIKEGRIVESRAGNKTYHSYEGDNFFAFVANAAQGRQMVKVLNKVKEHLRNKDVETAREVFENGIKGESGPAMEWKDFLSKTRPKKDEYGNHIPPVININEPFYVVPKGKSIIDIDDSISRRYGTYDAQGNFQTTFQDRTKGGSLSRQYQVGYTQERDADNPMAFRDVGSKGNPIYKYEPAKMVDPMTTMNRALNQIVRTTVMDDMKIAGIETWLREAEPLLKAPNVDDIRSAPWWYFKNADSPDAFRPGADKTTVANLLSNRFKTNQFIGTPSKYDLFMHDTAQKIADWSYDMLGPKGELVPAWLLTKTTSPITALRSFAYHTKLGLFAIPQLITQSQTYATIASLSPRSAPAGAYAAMLTQWSKLATNEGTIDLIDKWAAKMRLPGFHGFKPGEWKEALQEMNNRGFANVGREYSTLDTQMGFKYTQGVLGDVLDAGQMFFKAAEQNVRYGAWFTSYIEHKVANPGKVMTKTDWDKVLKRADDMSGNMSRASSSILQSGPLSLTGQFLTYQMHLAELYFSKRMTAMDRFRMHMMYGSLFGVTGAFGIMGLPLGEAIRKTAYDNGYVVGDNWLSTLAMEGAPAIGLAWLTSDDGDISKGNWYNVSSKFGVGGLTQFYDLLKSDAKWWTFLGGAATSIAGNTWNNTDSIRKAGWDAMQASMMTADPSKQFFKPTIDHWIDIFKEVSSVDAARKGYVGVQFGKWISKNDAYQADVSKANAIFMSLTGLNLTNAADNYIVGQDIKDNQARSKKALDLFVREYRRGVTAANNNDWPTFNTHMTNAYAWLDAYGYPIEDYPKAVAIASKGWETRINSIREEFYTKNVPAGKEEVYGDAWQRFIKTQGK